MTNLYVADLIATATCYNNTSTSFKCNKKKVINEKSVKL